MPEQFLRIGGSDGNSARGIRTDVEGFLEIRSRPKTEYETETLYEGIVEPGEDINMVIDWGNQSETWVAVQTDKPNWELARMNNVWSGRSSYTTGFYPRRENETKTFHEFWPAQSLVLPRIGPNEINEGYLYPTNILEAKALAEMEVGEIQFRYRNYNDEAATIKIQALKIWR